MPGKVWEWLVNTSPSMRREWIEMFFAGQNKCFPQLSPSMRREWIEISNEHLSHSADGVSLHAEGVD